MMRFIFPILLLLGNLFFAQKNMVDTLNEYNYEELKIKFNSYSDNDKVFQSKVIAQYYLQKAKKEKNNLQIAEGYNLIHFNEDFPQAMKYIDSISLVTKNVKGSQYYSLVYRMKGNLYYKYNNLKAALDNYILSLKYAKEQKDEKLIAYSNLNIAYINSYMGRNSEAAKIFRYYYYNEKKFLKSEHNQTRINLINCYIEINKLDSANILIQQGLKYSFENKNKYSISQYQYLSGLFNLKQKEYKNAIVELLKAYQYFSSINDNNANYVLFSLGKAYDGLENKEKTVQYFSTLDSNVQKTDITFPELREVYTYLIDYYKGNNDKEKQLYYIDRFLKVDKKLDEQFQYLSTEIPKKYDTPNLLQEKEDIINDLKNRKTVLYVSVSILIFILLLFVYFYYKAKKAEKQHRKIAQDLIYLIEKRNSGTASIKNESKTEISLTSEKIEIESKIKTVPDDVTQSILKNLEIFETKELFLKKGITSASLAKSIKTNTTYLSEVINTQKGKNFAAYLNDLRINYALNKLVKDRRFRSYKLSVISDELGYNNEQAFSLAFKKKTGTTLSIYLKEIEKQTGSENNTNN
ncbi:helix-turn-helix domain-containing protein [Chryseobacterium rhizosphaerae]|nr:helix-turn-helix domain-containing protein [Chryseobacterium rhizosphaerae]